MSKTPANKKEGLYRYFNKESSKCLDTSNLGPESSSSSDDETPIKRPRISHGDNRSPDARRRGRRIIVDDSSDDSSDAAEGEGEEEDVPADEGANPPQDAVQAAGLSSEQTTDVYQLVDLFLEDGANKVGVDCTEGEVLQHVRDNLKVIFSRGGAIPPEPAHIEQAVHARIAELRRTHEARRQNAGGGRVAMSFAFEEEKSSKEDDDDTAVDRWATRNGDGPDVEAFFEHLQLVGVPETFSPFCRLMHQHGVDASLQVDRMAAILEGEEGEEEEGGDDTSSACRRLDFGSGVAQVQGSTGTTRGAALDPDKTPLYKKLVDLRADFIRSNKAWVESLNPANTKTKGKLSLPGCTDDEVWSLVDACIKEYRSHWLGSDTDSVARLKGRRRLFLSTASGDAKQKIKKERGWAEGGSTRHTEENRKRHAATKAVKADRKEEAGDWADEFANIIDAALDRGSDAYTAALKALLEYGEDLPDGPAWEAGAKNCKRTVAMLYFRVLLQDYGPHQKEVLAALGVVSFPAPKVAKITEAATELFGPGPDGGPPTISIYGGSTKTLFFDLTHDHLSKGVGAGEMLEFLDRPGADTLLAAKETGRALSMNDAVTMFGAVAFPVCFSRYKGACGNMEGGIHEVLIDVLTGNPGSGALLSSLVKVQAEGDYKTGSTSLADGDIHATYLTFIFNAIGHPLIKTSEGGLKTKRDQFNDFKPSKTFDANKALKSGQYKHPPPFWNQSTKPTKVDRANKKSAFNKPTKDAYLEEIASSGNLAASRWTSKGGPAEPAKRKNPWEVFGFTSTKK